ncbi:S8 family serine peptidase [Roseateles sp.]|uniref:S8 family serine peptidase n=1 Tax=Roseateles sp. TaxID=1971397 RepID=UPI00391B165E
MNSKKLRPASLAVATLLAAMAVSAQAQEIRRSYIVQLANAPVASYEGGIAGLPATKPAAGSRLDVSAADVQAYIAYLDKKQNEVLSTINPAHITHRYDVVLNGFAAMLTDSEVRALKKNSGVARIEADEMLQPYTSYTSSFLGLDKAAGLWEQAGGKDKAGEDMIIAIVDSGVWPENLSFADRVDANGVPTHDPSGTLAYGPPPAKWKGTGCETSRGSDSGSIKAANCNNKLLGVRSFVALNAPIAATEFLTGRDGGGHGSHVASTAGGNANVPSTINGIDMGSMSGVAPRARRASYKTCFTGTTATNGGCATASSVASINQAVKDGADVINYSIGPTAGGGTLNDAVQAAFLNASNAGVFVAAAGGNSGPNTNPVSNLGPWHATVAASTHDRTVGAEAVVEGSGTYVGASVNQTPVASSNLILASVAALPGADAAQADLCYGAADGVVTLDPAKVAGKIVVCTRGVTARVNKSLAVQQAGGIGMILADNGAGLVAEPHSVPTIHINAADGAAVKNFVAANPAAQGSIGVAQVRFGDVLAPQTAGFSSRGPNVANNNILKPDFAAPGVDIVAGYVPGLTAAEASAIRAGSGTSKTAEGMISGTSMASPHVAGLAALIKQQRPSWTPAMIKSALATTAGDTYNDGVNLPLAWSATANANGRLPWAQGSGQVRPNLATDPGLVYDATAIDYARFSCGQNLGLFSAATCNAVGTIQPHNLNLASLTAASVMGSQTLTRTVTNVSDSSATYTAAVQMPGFNVEVSPSSFTIAPGAKQTYTVKLTRSTAPVDTWVYGSLTWSDGTRNVRSPLTARATALAAPASVYSEAATGSKIFTIGTGFAGSMVVERGGLKAATRSAATLTGTNTGSATTICRANNSPAVKVHDVAVPAGTLALRFSLFNADTTGGQLPGKEDDLDMLLLDSAGNALAGSLNDGSNESVQLTSPAAGNYKVCVISYSLQGRPSTNYTLSSWIVGPSDVGGNFRVLAPANAVIGGTASVGMSWSGLALGQRYLGAAAYRVGGVRQGVTLLEVLTNDPVPLAKSGRPVNAQE